MRDEVAPRPRRHGRRRCAWLAALALGLAGPAQADPRDAPPFDFVARHILGAERDPSVAAMSPRDFTEWMKASFLAHGEAAGREPAFGCIRPTKTQAARSYVLDPVRGDWAGDGSRERPYPGLATFMKGASRPDLAGGARLLLASGDHGRVSVPDLRNAATVSVEPAPGATPSIEALRIVAGKDLLFRGLVFSGIRKNGSSSRWLVQIEPKTSDIAFENNHIASNVEAGWTDADWNDRAMSGVFSRGTCAAFVGNDFRDLYAGLRSSGERALLAGNRFEGIVNDNINFSRDHQLVIGNVILPGRNNPLNKLHADAIQGWTEGGRTTRDIRIDGNLALHFQPMRSEPKANAKGHVSQKARHAVGAYRQGINIYTGSWRDVAVTGNVVVTNSEEGLVMLGLIDSVVRENVVLSSDPANFLARLSVERGMKGQPLENVVVEGNLADIIKLADEASPRANVALIRAALVPAGGPRKQSGAPAPRLSPDEVKIEGGPGGSSAGGIDPSRGIYDPRLRSP